MNPAPEHHDGPSDDVLEHLLRTTRPANPASERDAACPDPLVLAGWIDGRLDPEDAGGVDRHLARCAACTDAVTNTRLTLDEIAQHPVTPPTPLEIERVVAAIDPMRTRLRHAPVVDIIRWRRIAAAAIVALVCLSGYQLGRSTAPVSPDSPIDTRSVMSFGLLDQPDDRDALLSLVLQLTEEHE